MRITDEMPSPFNKVIKNEFDINTGDVQKLVPNLYDERKYVLHIRNLKLHLSLGLKLVKIHRVVEFTQKLFSKKFIDFNRQKRKEANLSRRTFLSK